MIACLRSLDEVSCALAHDALLTIAPRAVRLLPADFYLEPMPYTVCALWQQQISTSGEGGALFVDTLQAHETLLVIVRELNGLGHPPTDFRRIAPDKFHYFSHLPVDY